ncbi:MAG: MarC family protein [Candidatus Micrarchaeota archaeon]
MVEASLVEVFIRVFIPLLAIMDPFVSLPVFLSLTRKENVKKKHLIALEAVAIAGGLLFVFLFFGQSILSALGITFGSMQVAGGIVLGVMGLELVLGLSFPREKEKIKKVPPAALIIGTPVLSGPGVITTAIILSGQYGIWITAAAALLALVTTWAILRYSDIINNVIGETGTELLSRIMGLLLIAVAVQFALAGLKAAL